MLQCRLLLLRFHSRVDSAPAPCSPMAHLPKLFANVPACDVLCAPFCQFSAALRSVCSTWLLLGQLVRWCTWPGRLPQQKASLLAQWPRHHFVWIRMRCAATLLGLWPLLRQQGAPPSARM